MKWLALLLTNLLGSGIARVLTGAGLSVLSYAALLPLLLGSLNLAANWFGSVVAAGFQLALMTGVGQGLSMVGSAILTRAAIGAASVSIGKKGGA